MGARRVMRNLFMMIGVGITLIGVLMLLLFAYTVYQIVTAPEDVAVVQKLIELTEAEGPIIKGNMNIQSYFEQTGQTIPQDMSFELQMSQELKIIMFSIMAGMAGFLMALICKVIVGSGVLIVRACMQDKPKKVGNVDLAV